MPKIKLNWRQQLICMQLFLLFELVGLLLFERLSLLVAPVFVGLAFVVCLSFAAVGLLFCGYSIMGEGPDWRALLARGREHDA